MKLQDLFDQLTYGEFAQLSIGGQPTGQINENNWPHLVAHLNLALTNLYKRFNLKERTLKVELLQDKTHYVLLSDYSINSAKRPTEEHYIHDTLQDPFQDDLLRVEIVKVDSKRRLPLNERNQQYSVMTPKVNELVVPLNIANASMDLPEYLQSQFLEVVYRAAHPKIVIPLGYWDPSRVEIELPPTHLEACLYFMASRVNNPMGMDNEFHAGNTWYAKYEQACMDLENQGMQIQTDETVSRFERNGWV